MNHAFAIARRRAQRVAEARTHADKRNHILFCLDASRGRASINDGKGQASPAHVPLSACAIPSPIHQDRKDRAIE